MRAASLVETGRPGTLQIRLVDPATQQLPPASAAVPEIPARRRSQIKTAAPSSSAS